MMFASRFLLAGAMVALLPSLSPSPVAASDPLAVVAAENVYGDLARQIGGSAVRVTSILSNPDQDPHLFEADPATARALKGARVTLSNGIGYDAWMDKLLKADPSPGRVEVVVADVARKRDGDNPHLWYDPATMRALARHLADRFAALDAPNETRYREALAAFDASLAPLDRKIAVMRTRHAGVAVTASEPVFGYMAEALGLDMHDQRFQLAIMNDTEPSASDVAAFEDELKGHKVKAMLYNAQADDQAVKRLVGIAEAAKVPVVGVTETEPDGMTYQTWMLAQLDALDKALSGHGS